MPAKLRILNARTPQQWAEIIRAKWQENVASILEVCQLLCNSREELGAAAFWVMTRDDLKFSKGMVSQLMTIADDQKLPEVLHAKLPASWFTLYLLTRLTDEEFQQGLDSGAIHAGMERKDVALLKPPRDKPVRRREPLLTGRELIERRTLETRKQIVAVLHELTPAEQLEFIALLRFQLDDLEKRGEAA